MVLNQQETERLTVRIQNVVEAKNFQEFTACELAQALNADRYDVLFALHQMSSIERTARSADVVTDRWRVRTNLVKYSYEQVRTMLLADCR